MKNLFMTCLGFILLVLSSCTNNDNTQKPLKVLVLGNSVLRHPPDSGIGWNNDWGMAATSIDKDYFHQYISMLVHSNHYSSVQIEGLNISFWENDFAYDLDLFEDTADEKSYDVLVVRLGENVTDIANYYSALSLMINHYKSEKTKVIITGVIWQNATKDNIQKKLAVDNHYSFISLKYLQSNPENYSWGLFENEAVAAHPSDIGMKRIATSMYRATIKVY